MTDTERSAKTRIYDADHRMLPVGPYLSDTFAHLQFAYQKARLDLKGAHKDTWFGRLWNVLNPLLLGMVYWLLVMVIFNSGGESPMQVLAQILGGLFLFGLPSAALALGARSIVGGGTFVLNTRIPRLILPIGSVISSFLMFLPSLAVYAIFHVLAGFPIGPHLLWAIPLIALLLLLSLGLATLFATLNVFFRDVSSFLPYITRIWLYLSPIIYLYSTIPDNLSWALMINPIGGLFAAWQQALFEGINPSANFLAAAIGWSVAILILGVYSFLRREREFAIRI